MKNTFLLTLIFAGVVLASCSTTECIGGACADVDTTIRFKPTDNDYVAQNKKQTYLSQKGSSTKKPTVAKKDTVVIIQKIVVKEVVAPKKEVAPTPKVAKKTKAVVKAEQSNVPTLQESQMLNFDAPGQKPYNPILFK